MEEELARGVRPERLAFVSFTKKAVGEASARAQAKFNLSERELPYFRTIHSLAYRLLGVTRGEMMQHKHWDELGGALGYTFSRYVNAHDDGAAPAGRERGDLLRFIEQLARARCVSMDEQIHASREEVTTQELARYLSTLAGYKRDAGVMDFTDLLERYVADGAPCPVDVAIIDEAQDLSRLQWQMIKRVFAGVARIYVAGDDDQAIFTWSGADIDTFLSLKGEREVLGVTHRLPRAIYDYSQSIVSRLSQRFEKAATPRAEQGALHRLADWQQAPVGEGGSWMLLARNSFLLAPVKEWLHGAGVPYATVFGSSVDAKHLRAIIAWEKLRKGEALPASAVREVYDLMEVTHGHKTLPKVEAEELLTLLDLLTFHGCLTNAPWFDALTKIPARARVYYQAIKRRGESLARPPRIYVGTIHCSPPDERVLTVTGWRTLGELREETDRLVSYNPKCNAVICGKNTTGHGAIGGRNGEGYSFKKATSAYTGRLVLINTPRSTTRVTPEHRIRLRFNENFYGRWLVYLMRRGGWWRVGMCTTAHKPYKSGGVGARIATEQADAGWILSVHDTRSAAIAAEAVVQGLYGIPSLTFESAKDRALSSSELRAVHTATAAAVNARVTALFADHGLFIDAPLYTRGDDRDAFAGYWFDTVAANACALSDRIDIPFVDVRPKRGRWSPAKIRATITSAEYTGTVISLDVSPYHYYVSDGAVVHNSVKGGEADNVALLPDMTQRTWDSYERDRDAEHRTAYVGVTRAKEALYLIAPSTPRYYSL